MTSLVVGLALLATTFALFRLSLPRLEGQPRAFITKHGADGYIAVAITLGSALGVVALAYGAVELSANRN
jgi:hypothetical protein